MQFDLTTILGCSVHDVRMRELLAYCEEQPKATEREEELGGTYYLEFLRSGFSLYMTGNDIVETVHIYPRANGEYLGFHDELPLGLKADDTRAQARTSLGSPSHSGGPVRFLASYPLVHWDRWDYQRHSIHLEYPEHCDSIRLVTLTLIT